MRAFQEKLGPSALRTGPAKRVPVYLPLDCDASHTPLALSASAFRLGRSFGMFLTWTSREKQPETSPGCKTIPCATLSGAHCEPLRTVRAHEPPRFCGRQRRRSLSTPLIDTWHQSPPISRLSIFHKGNCCFVLIFLISFQTQMSNKVSVVREAEPSQAKELKLRLFISSFCQYPSIHPFS